ncbi:MAG: hypothetical protein ACR2NA_14215 [Solirubrobacterales bacterium]
MSGTWVLSTVLLWLAVCGLTLLCLSLLRQVAELRARLGPAGAAPIAPGLVVGRAHLGGLDGGSVALGGGSAAVLVWFADDCPACEWILPRLGPLAAEDQVAVIVGANRPAGLDPRVAVVRTAELPPPLQGLGAPLVVTVTGAGTVAALGRPREAVELELMRRIAHGADVGAPGSVREHLWGSSLPYWESPPQASDNAFAGRA